ncbi:MAG: hypothetical protein RR330_07295 [Alistipes sp.]
MQQLFNGGKSGSFKGEGSKPGATDTYYAAYPEQTLVTEGRAEFTIPVAQTGVPEPLMAAMCENVASDAIDFKFAPVNATLHITLDQAVDKISFAACDGAYVAGNYIFDYKTGVATLAGTERIITVTPAVATTDLLISVPAATYAKGYKLTVEKNNTSMVYSFNYRTGITFEKGKSYPLSLTFKPITFTTGNAKTSYNNNGVTQVDNNYDGNKMAISGNWSFSGGISNTLITEAGVYYEDPNGVRTYLAQVATPTAGANLCNPVDLTPAWNGYKIYTYIKLIDQTEIRSTAIAASVTGLPFTADFAQHDCNFYGISKQNTGNVAEAEGFVKLTSAGSSNNSGGFILPKFYLPADTNVALASKIKKFKSQGFIKCAIYVARCNGTWDGTESSGNIAPSEKQGLVDWNTNHTLTASHPTFCYWMGGLVGQIIGVTSLSITYR